MQDSVASDLIRPQELFARAVQVFAAKLPVQWDAELHLAFADADGELLATTDPGTPNGMMTAFCTIRDFYGSDWNEGDIALTNDVFGGSSHPCEFTAVTPLFSGEGRTIEGWYVLRTMFGDVGGWDLGNYTFRALDVWAEGVRIMPIKIARRGKMRPEVLEILRINSRTPHLNAACASGLVDAAHTLRQARPPADFMNVLRSRLAEARQRAGARLAALPAGTSESTTAVSCAGIVDQEVRIGISVDRAAVHVRFLDVPAPSPGPINATSFMVRDAVLRALCECTGTGGQDALAIANLCNVEIPEKTMLSVTETAPVSHAGRVTCKAIEAAMRAGLNSLGIGSGRGSERASGDIRSAEGVDGEKGVLTESGRQRILSAEKALGDQKCA